MRPAAGRAEGKVKSEKLKVKSFQQQRNTRKGKSMSIQKASGNMYEWVDYVHSYLRGACPYACPYCYVQAIAKRFGNDAMKGPLCFDEKQLEVNYCADKYIGKTIFIEHTHDLFHPDVETKSIEKVVIKCFSSAFINGLNFVFQTRNTLRAYSFLRDAGFNPDTTFGTTLCRALGKFRHAGFNPDTTFGTTIETNREVGNAPAMWKQAED